MPTINLLKCDICGEEQRSDRTTHWTLIFGTNLKIDFKGLCGLQWEKKFEVLCYPCGKAIQDSICNTIEKIQNSETKSYL